MDDLRPRKAIHVEVASGDARPPVAGPAGPLCLIGEQRDAPPNLAATHHCRKDTFVERVIGSIRRECTDHVVALGEEQLRRVLREYAEYCNRARCHLSLERNAPEPRAVEDGRGAVRAVPHLGGFHHRYTRAA